jgi:hypothetical protein
LNLLRFGFEESAVNCWPEGGFLEDFSPYVLHGPPVKKIDGGTIEGMSEEGKIGPESKRRATDLGVERHPKTGRPLDPEAGLGGIFKSRLPVREIKAFFGYYFPVPNAAAKAFEIVLSALTCAFPA